MGLIIVYEHIKHQYFSSLLVFITSSTKTESGNEVMDSKTESGKETQAADYFFPP